MTGPADDLPVAEFAFPGPLRDQLVAAILAGEKTATAGLLAQFEAEGEALPEVGSRAAVVNSDQRPVVVIETTEVRVVRAAEIDVRFARNEGEGGFASMAEWRDAHERFWTSAPMRELLGEELEITDDTLVVAARCRVLQVL